MQWFSVEQQQSQGLEAHADVFATFKIAGNENPSILIPLLLKQSLEGS